MSKLEELIAELCPDGVEYKTLGEIGTLTRGKRFVRADILEEGTPCIHYGDLYTYYGIWADKAKTYLDPEQAATLRFAKKGDVVIVGAGENNEDIGVGVAWFGEENAAVHDACYIFSNHNLNPKYLSYYLRSNVYHSQIKKYVSEGKICAISAEGIGKSLMPVPPLEIQSEIVRILDAFSELKAELNAVLKAELKTRKKQYEYYKEYVFNRYITEETQFLPLNELADVRDGTHDSPKSSSTGKYLITSKNIKNGTINFDRAYLISNEDFEKINQRSKVDKWDLLFTMIGTVGEIGLVSDEPDYAIKNVGLIKTGNEIFAKFLKYYLNTSISRDYVNENRSKGTQVFLALGKLKKIPIPILTEEEQKRIVSILDNYDKLCSSLTSGLPAEIEAREKQYEYYRDLLLTFKPKVTA